MSTSMCGCLYFQGQVARARARVRARARAGGRAGLAAGSIPTVQLVCAW